MFYQSPKILHCIISSQSSRVPNQVILTSIISYNSLKLDPGSLRLEMEAVSRDLVARQVQKSPTLWINY